MAHEQGRSQPDKTRFELSKDRLADYWRLTGYCPHCDVYFTFEVDQDNMRVARDQRESVTLIYESCNLCGDLIVLLDRNREDLAKEILYPRYPAWQLSLPAKIDDIYCEIYREAVLTLSHSPRSSAMLCRALLQLILREHYKIKLKSDNLALEIIELISEHDIPSYLHKDFDRLKEMGNLAAHPLLDRETGELLKVEPEEAQWLLDMIKVFMDFAFVQPKEQQERRLKLDEKISDSKKLRKDRKK